MNVNLISIIAVLILVLTYQNTLGQGTNDTIVLSEVEIPGRKAFTQPSEYQIDSAIINNTSLINLNQLIESRIPVSHKTYGAGGISTISFRGLPSSQTSVTWNGMEINSPMLGVSDVSFFPAAFIDELAFTGQKTPGSFNNGLGNSLMLNSQPDWNNKLSVDLAQSAGSFGTYNSLVRAGFGNRKLQSETGFFFQTSENDFDYKNIAVDPDNPPEETMNHGAYSQRVITQDVHFLAGKTNLLSGHFWFQNSERELPPTMLSANQDGGEEQDQDIARAMLKWRNITRKGQLLVKAGYQYDYLNYFNEPASINSRNASHSLMTTGGYSYSLNNSISFSADVSNKYDWVITNNYNGAQSRNHLYFTFGAVHKISNRLNYSVSLRQDLIDDELPGLSPKADIRLGILQRKRLDAVFSIQRSLRYPTLNDLFWDPGGNPKLEPEKGLGFEAGLMTSLDSIERFSISAGLTYFFNNIKDMITWLPSDEFSYWAPQNQDEVISEGIEAKLSASILLNKTRLKASTGYRYASISKEGGDLSGKQLIYVPRHIFTGDLIVSSGRFFLNLNHAWYSRRYTTQDNADYLPQYMIDNATASYKLHLKKSTISLSVSANNIFDTDYQVIAWYPVHGRNYMVTVAFGFGE